MLRLSTRTLFQSSNCFPNAKVVFFSVVLILQTTYTKDQVLVDIVITLASHGRERRFSKRLTVYTRGNFQGRKWFGITASQRRLSRGVVPTASFFSKMFTISGSICQYLAGEVVAGIGLKQARAQCVHAIVHQTNSITTPMERPQWFHSEIIVTIR